MTDRPIDYFYADHEAVDIEDKIRVLEKQFQEFPNRAMDREKLLTYLEAKFEKMINYADVLKEKQLQGKDRWKNAYQQVSDAPVGGNMGMGGLDIKMSDSELYNPYDGSGMRIERDN